MRRQKKRLRVTTHEVAQYAESQSLSRPDAELATKPCMRYRIYLVAQARRRGRAVTLGQIATMPVVAQYPPAVSNRVHHVCFGARDIMNVQISQPATVQRFRILVSHPKISAPDLHVGGNFSGITVHHHSPGLQNICTIGDL